MYDGLLLHPSNGSLPKRTQEAPFRPAGLLFCSGTTILSLEIKRRPGSREARDGAEVPMSCCKRLKYTKCADAP
jgi:hypothetical protein